MKSTILIDTDGVLRDFNGAALYFIKKEHPEIPQDAETTQYKIEKDLGITRKEFNRIVYEKYCKEIFEDAHPYEGAVSFVKTLIKSGHKVYFASSQPTFDAMKYTVSWYNKILTSTTDLLFLNNKYEFACDFLIDDAPSQIIRASLARKVLGTPKVTIVFPQKWNSDLLERACDEDVDNTYLYAPIETESIKKYEHILNFIENEWDWVCIKEQSIDKIEQLYKEGLK